MPTRSGRARRPVTVLLLVAAALVASIPTDAAPCEAFRFAPARDVLPLPAKVEAVRLARVVDLTGDGRPDLVVLDVTGNVVHGAIQRPDGSFTPLTPLAATRPELVAKVASVPYDVVNRDEARRLVEIAAKK